LRTFPVGPRQAGGRPAGRNDAGIAALARQRIMRERTRQSPHIRGWRCPSPHRAGGGREDCPRDVVDLAGGHLAGAELGPESGPANRCRAPEPLGPASAEGHITGRATNPIAGRVGRQTPHSTVPGTYLFGPAATSTTHPSGRGRGFISRLSIRHQVAEHSGLVRVEEDLARARSSGTPTENRRRQGPPKFDGIDQLGENCAERQVVAAGGLVSACRSPALQHLRRIGPWTGRTGTAADRGREKSGSAYWLRAAGNADPWARSWGWPFRNQERR